MKSYYVYIMTNQGRTTLYTGVTNSLVRRVTQHRQGETPGFTKRYNINRLMYYESFSDVRAAIAREKQIKGWSRAKKDALIGQANPQWGDLAVTVLGLDAASPAKWQERGAWFAGDSRCDGPAKGEPLRQAKGDSLRQAQGRLSLRSE